MCDVEGSVVKLNMTCSFMRRSDKPASMHRSRAIHIAAVVTAAPIVTSPTLSKCREKTLMPVATPRQNYLAKLRQDAAKYKALGTRRREVTHLTSVKLIPLLGLTLRLA
jgi:hypothetical protein